MQTLHVIICIKNASDLKRARTIKFLACQRAFTIVGYLSKGAFAFRDYIQFYDSKINDHSSELSLQNLPHLKIKAHSIHLNFLFSLVADENTCQQAPTRGKILPQCNERIYGKRNF